VGSLSIKSHQLQTLAVFLIEAFVPIWIKPGLEPSEAPFERTVFRTSECFSKWLVFKRQLPAGYGRPLTSTQIAPKLPLEMWKQFFWIVTLSQ
jgi:hypothetical protein